MIEKDIITLDDVKLLVDSFYTKVREDQMLGPIFDGIIQDRWPIHLEKMYRFWQTVLLSEHTYSGSPFLPHASMPLTREHFDRWLDLFYKTIDDHFQGDKAYEAKWRANKMAEMFLYKINYIQNSQKTTLK